MDSRWQNEVCEHISRCMGIEPPPRKALARKSFHRRIQIVLDKWMVQYKKDWPTHKEVYGKDRIYEAEVMDSFVNGGGDCSDKKSNPTDSRRKRKQCRWANYEWKRISKALACMAVGQISKNGRDMWLLGELDKLRNEALNADYDKMVAKARTPKMREALGSRREELATSGSLVSHILIEAMGLYNFQCRSQVNEKGKLVLLETPKP